MLRQRERKIVSLVSHCGVASGQIVQKLLFEIGEDPDLTFLGRWDHSPNPLYAPVKSWIPQRLANYRRVPALASNLKECLERNAHDWIIGLLQKLFHSYCAIDLSLRLSSA